MKVSREELNRLVELYLNDINDYGGEEDKAFITLAESSLPNLKILLTESNSDDMYSSLKSLNESLTGKSKEVVTDFITYIDNIR